MQDFQEMEIRILQLITDSQLPEEVLIKINEVYIEFKEACDICVCDLRFTKDTDTINLLKLKDTITYEYNKYMYKINQIIEEAVDRKNMKRVSRVKSETLKKEQEEVSKNICQKEDNEQFIQVVQTALKNNLLSSKDTILSAMDASSSEIQEAIEKQDTRAKLREKIDKIVEKIENEFPNISQALQKQDEEMVQTIMNIIQPQHLEEQREKFLNAIKQGAIVKEDVAQKRVEEQNKLTTEHNTKEYRE